MSLVEELMAINEIVKEFREKNDSKGMNEFLQTIMVESDLVIKVNKLKTISLALKHYPNYFESVFMNKREELNTEFSDIKIKVTEEYKSTMKLLGY